MRKRMVFPSRWVVLFAVAAVGALLLPKSARAQGATAVIEVEFTAPNAWNVTAAGTLQADNYGQIDNPGAMPAGTAIYVDGSQVDKKNCAKPGCFHFVLPPGTSSPHALTVSLMGAAGNEVLSTPTDALSVSGGGAQPPPPITPLSNDDNEVVAGQLTYGDEKAAYQTVLNKAHHEWSITNSEYDKYYEADPNNLYFDRLLTTSPNVAILFFDTSGQPLWPLPLVGEDDTLYVVVVRPPGDTTPQPQITACNKPQVLRIGGSAKAPSPLKVYAASRPAGLAQPWVVVATACASEQGFRAVGSTNAPQGKSAAVYEIDVPTLALYRLTLGLGFVYDWSHQVQFNSSPVKGENVPVIVRDEHVRGLTPPIVMLSLRPFKVDAKRIRFDHRIWPAPTLGFSIVAPTEHLFIGALVEPWPGLGLIGGAHVHQEPSLGGGYHEGDRVPTGQIPTDMRWGWNSSQDWFIGLNVDATLIATLIGSIL